VAINYLPAASALCSTVTTGHQGISANDLLTIVAFVCSLRHDFYTTLSNTSQGGLRRRLPGDPSIAILKRRSSVEAEVESVLHHPQGLQVISTPGEAAAKTLARIGCTGAKSSRPAIRGWAERFPLTRPGKALAKAWERVSRIPAVIHLFT
jgi:hypothetical protein